MQFASRRLNPLPFITGLPKICSTESNVLDIGTGSGRNAIFFADKGFKVVALDKSATAIAELSKYAGRNSLSLDPVLLDLRKEFPKFSIYQIVLCTLVLHTLTTSQATDLLVRARKEALCGTIHAIAAITKDGDFFRNNPKEDKYYPDSDEIIKSYRNAGWLVHQEFLEERSMMQTNPTGSNLNNIVCFLIASKP